MSKAPVHRAAEAPIKVHLTAGETYVWCACGRSSTQPFCDGSHQGTGIDPLVFEAEKEGDVWLCMCKHTATPPLCDGTHKEICAIDQKLADTE